MTEYVKGDATQPPGDGSRIIVHVCNDVGGWGRGFVMALSDRWKEPEQRYRAWYRGDESDLPFELGQVQLVAVEENLWVANIIGQRGLRWSAGRPPIRYDAVRAGLSRVRAFARKHDATVHMPRIGCGLAGGKWKEVESVIEEELTNQGVHVSVYDFE